MTHHLTSFARQLRHKSTDAEQRLWYHLRSRYFGEYKFRRQHPIGNYIVDFVCLEKTLIIELDGSQHREQVEYDEQRDRWLRGQGFTILRFWDNEVFENIDGVLERIRQHLLQSPSP